MILFVASSLIQKLTGKLLQRVEALIGIKDDLKQLQEQLAITQSYLARFISAGHHGEPTVIQDLIDLSREAEDTIDQYTSFVAAQQRDANHWFQTRSWPSQLFQQHRMVKKIKQIIKNFKEVYKEKERLGIESLQPGQSSTSSEEDVATVRQNLTVEETNENFASGLKLVMQRVMEGQQSTEVVSIFGMGGLGKTTLARKVYDDQRVVQKFRFRAWVDVFQGCRVRDVLEDIMKCALGITMSDTEHMSDDELGLELRKHLRSTPYLIVLDDVFATDLLEPLNGIFSNNMYGSRIIITTRCKEVAQFEKSRSFVYKVDQLSKEDSWKLFCENLFPGRTCPGELEVIGKQIVNCCEGIPQAIMVLAGVLLLTEKNHRSWSEVSSRVSSFLGRGTNKRSELLELSYSRLPHLLRPCFLYLSLFPKHMEIPTRKLIRLWIAEGFVYKNNCPTLEETGQCYLEELIARNLIQIKRRRFDGSIRSCSIHDFIHEFCTSKVKVENFLEVIKRNGSSLPSNTPRACFHTAMSKSILSSQSNPRLRSMICINTEGEQLSDKEWKFIENNFPLLRVLDLWDKEMEYIPKHIDNLMHLKYVRLKSLTAKSIPASICNLFKLQMLEITTPLIHRPVIDIWKLQELRHLYFQGEAVIQEPRDDFGNYDLKNLLTLCSISPDSCKECVLSKLPNLIKLGINGDLAEDIGLAFEHLALLLSLRTLKLERDRRCNELNNLPEANKFPPNITKLTLSETQLSVDPMHALGQLPNLLVLKLQNAAYSGPELACGIASFPKLRVLKLLNMGIHSWSVAEGSMLRLESIVIRRCGKLKGLPLALEKVPAFLQMELWSPNVSVVKDARSIQVLRGVQRFKLVIYQS